MRKIGLLLFLITVLIGCSNSNDYKYLSYSGEGENWQGEYTVNTNSKKNSENGNFIFSFKDFEENMEFKDFELIINDGEYNIKKEVHTEGTVEFPTGCSGCLVISGDENIEVTIKWNNDNEDTFLLKRR